MIQFLVHGGRSLCFVFIGFIEVLAGVVYQFVGFRTSDSRFLAGRYLSCTFYNIFSVYVFCFLIQNLSRDEIGTTGLDGVYIRLVSFLLIVTV